jgi:hypothetical protein
MGWEVYGETDFYLCIKVVTVPYNVNTLERYFLD